MKKRYISICSILLIVIGVMLGIYKSGKNILKKFDKIQLMSKKHLSLFLLMIQWMKTKQEGKNIADFLEKTNYKNIAIYGIGCIGELLVNELKDTNINVLYGIDRNANSINSTIDIVSINDNFKSVDAVIVTAITFFDEIYKELSRRINCPIISLEDILDIL